MLWQVKLVQSTSRLVNVTANVTQMLANLARHQLPILRHSIRHYSSYLEVTPRYVLFFVGISAITAYYPSYTFFDGIVTLVEYASSRSRAAS